MSRTTKMNDNEIISKIEAAVKLHRESKDKLITRMKQLLDPVTDTTLHIGPHTIVYQTVYAACSQWGNNAYAVTGKAKAYVIDDTWTLGDVDCSFWDGSNQQNQFGCVRRELEGEGNLKPAPSKLLREIAKLLPRSLAEWADREAKSATANDSTLAQKGAL